MSSIVLLAAQRRVVDQEVDAAELLQRRPPPSLDGGRVGDIGEAAIALPPLLSISLTTRRPRLGWTAH